MSQENVEIIRAAIDAWNRGDWDEALKDAAPDFELDNSSNAGEWRGVHLGPDEVRRMWKQFHEAWESVRLEIDEFIEADEHVVTRQTASRSPRRTWLILAPRQRVRHMTTVRPIPRGLLA